MQASPTEANEFDGLCNDELKTLLLIERAEHLATKAELQSQRSMIESMKLHILKLRRMQFGQHSEKRAQQIDQLELWVEELETTEAANASPSEPHESPSRFVLPHRKMLPRV